MNLSPHFTLAEMTTSQEAVRHGINNTAPPDVYDRLKETCAQLEAVRSLLGKPLIVSSGYRSPALNKAIGGSASSAHVKGDAVDFICPIVGNPLKICRIISASKIQFDQLIQEGSWVHISFSIPMRQEILTAHFGEHGVTYTHGLGG